MTTVITIQPEIHKCLYNILCQSIPKWMRYFSCAGMAGVNTLVGSVRQTDIDLQVSNRSWEWGRTHWAIPPSIRCFCAALLSIFYQAGRMVNSSGLLPAQALFQSCHPPFICMPSLFNQCKDLYFPSIPPSCWSVSKQLLALVHFPTLFSTLVTASFSAFHHYHPFIHVVSRGGQYMSVCSFWHWSTSPFSEED